MSLIPLQHRLPNPPALFQGRKAELRWVTRMLTRSPMTFIAGLGGLGKTALALEVLHKHFKAQVPNTIHIRPQANGQDLLRQLWQVLSKVLKVQIQDRVISSDPDFALATLIDMADEGRWWFLIEDLHRLQDPQKEHTLLKIAQYARTSRWLVTSRVTPTLDLNQHVLRIENLEPRALDAIAKLWDPKLTTAERQRALEASTGSPWRLYQALAGDPLEDPTLLEGVTEPQRRLLQSLLVLESAVPVPLLLNACQGVQEADWRTLERRGLLIGSYQACGLHDLTREALLASPRSHQHDEALCQALLASPSPELKWEGLKLGSRLGHALRALLGEPDTPVEDNGMVELLIQAGLGLELDALIDNEGDESLSTVRLLIALRTGTIQNLEAMSPPKANSSTSERLLWARGLFIRHLYAQALELTRELLTETQRDEVRLLEASCLAALGEVKQAEERLCQFVAADPDRDWDRLELLATVLAGMGKHQDALALADQLRPRLSHMTGAALTKRAWRMVGVYYLLYRHEQAQQLLDWIVKEVGERGIALYSGRGILEYRSILALELGQFDQVQPLRNYRASDNTPNYVLMRNRLHMAQAQLSTGDLEGLRARLVELAAHARQMRYGDAFCSATFMRIQLDVLEGAPWRPPEEHTLSASLPILNHLQPIMHLRWRILEGHHWDDAADELMTHVEGHTPLHCSVMMTQAMAFATQGDHGRASQLSLESLKKLRQTGMRVTLARALIQACDLFWILSQRSLHAQLAQELHALNQRMSSPRFSAAAKWHMALSGSRPISPALVESLKTGRDPVTARRAGALLGDDAPLHEWDRQVLDRILNLKDVWSPIQVRTWTGQGPVWGVDFHRKGLWDHTGTWHDLGRRGGLLGLIQVLIEQGGEASKEALVRGVWGEPEYHPLKHDNRLRLAVRRFRALLQPADPIQATSDGYALRGRVRICGHA